MDLYVLRHGKAQDHGLAAGDFERNLTVEGKAEVEKIACSMRKLGLRFDYVATSPLNRAKQTAVVVLEQFGSNRLEEWNELKPEARLPDLYGRLSALGASSKVLLVGHEPLLSSLVADAMADGGPTECRLALKKGGLARIAVTSIRRDRLSGILVWLLTPKLLRRLS